MGWASFWPPYIRLHVVSLRLSSDPFSDHDKFFSLRCICFVRAATVFALVVMLLITLPPALATVCIAYGSHVCLLNVLGRSQRRRALCVFPSDPGHALAAVWVATTHERRCAKCLRRVQAIDTIVQSFWVPQLTRKLIRTDAISGI